MSKPSAVRIFSLSNVFGCLMLITRLVSGTSSIMGRVDTGQYSVGTCYDFKIFNKALTQAEITEDFDSNGASILASNINNLVAWYPIREQEGFVLKDQSPNALNGILGNYTLVDVTVGINNQRVDKYKNPIKQY